MARAKYLLCIKKFFSSLRSRRPFWVLVVCLLVTFAVTWQFHETQDRKDYQRFITRTEAARNTIASRMNMYIAMIRATSGLFAASDYVTHEEFKSYISRLEIREFYPGIQGIGLTKRIKADNLKKFVASRRAAGQKDFHVWPDHSREEYHVITYLEPLDRRNRAAIGFDMFTDPVRREAMELARDTGMPAASGKVTLVQEIYEDVQAGFLIYIPLYRKGIMPEEIEDRRKNLMGYVYAPFRAGDLLRNTFHGQHGLESDYAVYDGLHADESRLLYSSVKDNDPLPSGFRPRLKVTHTLQVAGRTWSMVFTNRPEFDANTNESLLPIIFASGLIISFTLAAITWAESRSRRESEIKAEWLRRSQEELGESQARLLENDKRKDEFLAVLAHELRNPLAPVYNSLQIMKRSPDPGTQKEMRDIMENQIGHMIRLVDDLMDVSRITRGKIELRRTPLDLAGIIDSSVEAVRPLIEERRHILGIDIPEVPITVLADKTRISQVFTNLLNNAAKYTPEGGSINISVVLDEGHVDVKIADTGIGIPEDKRDYIFDLFTQASGEEAGPYGGLGIGLMLVRSFVQMHGGHVSVESDGDGKGSTFTVTLPLMISQTVERQALY